MSIGQVMIHVTSLDVAKKFYIDILGLKVKSDLSQELGMYIIENEGCYFTLHEGFKPNTQDYDQCKTVVILRVSDIEQMKSKLLSQNVQLYGNIVETPVHYYQSTRDFDGNWIEVAQFKN